MIKKIKALLVAVLVSLSFGATNVALAQGFSLRVGGESTFSGSETTLTLQLSGSASMGGACGGVCGITTNLSYDAAKLELLSVTPSQGFDFTSGSTLVLYKATAANDGTILTLRFRNKSLSDGESTTVTFSNIVGTNADTEFSAPNASLTVKYVAPKQQEPTQPTQPSTPSQPKNDDHHSSTTTPSQSENKETYVEKETNEQQGKDSEKSKKSSEEADTENSEENSEQNKADENNKTGSAIVAVIVAALALVAGVFAFLFIKKKHSKKTRR